MRMQSDPEYCSQFSSPICTRLSVSETQKKVHRRAGKLTKGVEQLQREEQLYAHVHVCVHVHLFTRMSQSLLARRQIPEEGYDTEV